VVAHNLATTKDFDQILVLRGGQIVERGTHEELQRLRGHYSELYALQNSSAGVSVRRG
jgi:ABC-type multidrug transport system fused ATPase/permease subunit